ncbi:MAG TPA: aromatic ring-hydroxylating dioxygenase subunit alpha [Caulobacteraceae bacterium]|jgi:phenylpropionate dioxygenase-like ring-hydroxylating dioxygenase large terminal subunit|nr:aromatic ring-hydroxylating dioxygenase subunit alpha [Caulobacteraceae bacterium]
MFLRDCWYVAAWEHELAGEGLLARRIVGDRVVLYRRADGGVAALADACSHRLAPLSLGRREGDRVRCMYHGLLFDGGGRCVEIPGQDRIAERAHIRSYPVVERDRFIWIWMGDPALADPAAIPDCHWQADPGWRSIPATMHYKADYRLIADNLLDFSHLSFVHENSLGGSSTIALTRPKIDLIDGGLRLTRWYLGEPDLAPYLRGLADLEGPIDRWHIYDWLTAGNVLSMDSGSAPAGTGAPEGRRDPRAVQFHAVQVLTPEDEHNTHFFWTYGHDFNLDDPAFTRALADRIQVGFEEDRTIIEAQQAVMLERPEAVMVDLAVDQAPMLARSLMTRRLQAEAAGA